MRAARGELRRVWSSLFRALCLPFRPPRHAANAPGSGTPPPQAMPPLLPPRDFRFARLLWAYAVVESRGMVVSGLDGGGNQRVTALVPVADMLNHRATAQVRPCADAPHAHCVYTMHACTCHMSHAHGHAHAHDSCMHMHATLMSQLGSPTLEPAVAAATAAVAPTEAAAVVPSVAATTPGAGPAGLAGVAPARCLVFRTLCAVGAGEQLYLYYGRFSCLQTLQFYGTHAYLRMPTYACRPSHACAVLYIPHYASPLYFHCVSISFV